MSEPIRPAAEECCDPLYLPLLERRGFLAAGGLAVLCALARAGAQERQRPRGGEAERAQLDTWLQISPDSAVTVYTGKVELGQNIRTVLAQVVAEELHLEAADITLVMGDTDLSPYDAGTFGSQTTPRMMPVLRAAAAAAREALLDLAAARWQVDRATLSLEGGQVVQRSSNRRMAFGELTAGRRLVRTITGVPSVPPAQWRVTGRPLRKLNGPAIVTGQHRYPSDITRPGMLHGRVLRPPAAGAKLRDLETGAAAALPGVQVVREGDFVGVTAPDEHQAALAIEALRATWQPGTGPSNAELFSILRPAPVSTLANAAASPVAAGLAAAEVRLEQTYTVAYIAHTPLEPRAAVAEWEAGKLTVWTGTQRPFGVHEELVRAFRLPPEQVRVQMPDVGSGYGGKHTGECALEAARLAQAVGRPVKVQWSREEEFQWAYFRPAGVMDVLVGARRDGTLTAWEMHNHNSGPAGLDAPYDVPHKKVEFHRASSPLRQGSYRGLAGPANFFARETALDELAVALRLDPLALRLKNLSNPRLRAVCEAAAQRFGWGRTPPRGRGYGLACGFEKGSWVATCAEVAVTDQRIQVLRMVTAFDCGAVLNPDTVRNQIEGMHVMGLGAALFEAIEFANGQIHNRWLSRYRVPRFRDLVPLEIVLLDRRDQPSVGAGETPMMALAPAIGNAVYQACGTRLRGLPLIFPPSG